MKSLPFALTRAQRNARAAIAKDLAQPHPMRRLLQGDVGSGKTLVAALGALQAIENGWQAALMAPTEILAEQHYLKLSHWLEPLGVRIAWLAGGLKARAKKAALAAIAGGETQLAIGTHALFQQDVRFARLGLAIVDEQHRFGVEQRLALAAKGGGEPAPAHDERHPHPAHALDELLRRPGRDRDRRAAPGAHAGRHQARLGRAPRRGGAARARELPRRRARPTGSAR